MRAPRGSTESNHHPLTAGPTSVGDEAWKLFQEASHGPSRERVPKVWRAAGRIEPATYRASSLPSEHSPWAACSYCIPRRQVGISRRFHPAPSSTTS